MNLSDVENKRVIIGAVGLGYVGLPLAISFAKKFKVIGFDINAAKVKKYEEGIDVTNEVGDEAVKNTTMTFTSNEKDINVADFIIVAVPTPIDSHDNPDLTPVVESSKIVGRNMKKGAIVIYESTVYPGLTEEICVPILEKESNMKCGVDFKVAYSPERINPGDKVHRFETITKIVSGMDEETLDLVDKLYSSVLQNGTYRAASIKVAEAAKVIENTQRDINIAFANELAVIFNKLGIDTNEVLDAAGSKWNFLDFRPGLVGGHCIGVDPFYLISKSKEAGYQPELLMAGRKVNDGMGKFIADNVVKKFIKADKKVKNAKVLVLGLTFKENVGDLRNSKVINIIRELEDFGVKVYARDPYADLEEIEKEYNIKIDENKENEKVDAVILAVAHNEYKNLSIAEIKELLKQDSNLVFDIKRVVDKEKAENEGIDLWRL